jgi:hypothetical protein
MKIGENILTQSKVILLYDGDALAYRAAAVVEERKVEVTHVPTSLVRTFKTRTEFKDILKAKDKEFDPEIYKFKDILIPQDKVNALAILKNQIKAINSQLFADEYVIALSGKSNFRDNLELPEKYKGNREAMIRPTHLKECKNYLWKSHPSILAQNEEADDVVIYKGYEYLAQGHTPIIVGMDKDSYAYGGLTLFDFTKERPEPDYIQPGLGYLEHTGKKHTGRGFKWFAFQWLVGDTTDHYCPYRLAGAYFGAASAFKLIKDCQSEQEVLDLVIKKYKEWYPAEFTYKAWDGTDVVSDAKKMLQLYFRCARMKETHDDDQDLDKFLNRYGVKYE